MSIQLWTWTEHRSSLRSRYWKECGLDLYKYCERCQLQILRNCRQWAWQMQHLQPQAYCGMIMRVVRAVERKTETDMILNQYRALPKYTLLSDLLNQIFTFLALASMANRIFWTWICHSFIWNVMIKWSRCQLQIYLGKADLHTGIEVQFTDWFF